MAARIIDGKRFLIRQLSKKHTTPPHSTNESNPKQSTETLVARREVTPKTHIVVVRTTNSTKNEREETIETNETAPSKSVGLPAALTNGRTSVYLIRRPIPPPEVPRPTQLFQAEDYEEIRRTTTTKTRQNTHSPTTTQEVVNSSRDLPNQNHSSSQHRSHSENSTQSGNSRRRTRRLSSDHHHHPPTPPPPTEKESKGVQANLSSAESVENEQLVDTRRSRRKPSTIPQITSAHSIVLVNPKDKTIAIVENSYGKEGTIIKQYSKSLQKSRYQQNMNSQSTEELVKTSRWHRCLGCLSKHMCLIIIICLILCLIGLAGIGVSAYFLAINAKDNLVPTVIGIAIGGVLTIAAPCFLYCILGCIGSREGYFTYTGDDSRVGGRAFALISPGHPNAHHYFPSVNYENNKKSISIKQRQRTVFHQINNPKTVTIEMPERFLTRREMSPKTHERRLSKVVNNIRHVVEDAKKRFPNDVPTKVIVNVNQNAKATI